MKKFLVISCYEDGPSVHYYTEAELTRKLNDGEFEGYKFLKENELVSTLTEFPARSVIIFKGEQIIPQPVQKVVEYKL